MIPNKIMREHILKAIEQIDRDGYPDRYRSTKYSLLFRRKEYPPKYVIKIANFFANGKELRSGDFNGGKETNSFLKSLGFKVIPKGSLGPESENSESEPSQRHTERCPKCKETVLRMLRNIYGEVSTNYKIEVSPTLEAFQRHPFFATLKDILYELESYRGYAHCQFVRTNNLPACDYFVHKPGFIVEFDESQHFTIPRAITLENYPPEMEVGFSVHMWTNLCRKLRKKDNDPPYRDEQRAWYDTLRDFVPRIMGFRPTVRLYAEEQKWCDLDPESPSDTKMFREIIQNRHSPSRSRILTVLLQSNGKYGNTTRLKTLSRVVRETNRKFANQAIILFPAGWFTAGSSNADSIYRWVEDNVSHILRKNGKNLVAAIGIDGRETIQFPKDQVVAAINHKGIIAMGRKFYPAPSEKNYVRLARDWLKGGRYKRIFRVGDRAYFLCTCYDVFGLKKKDRAPERIDVVLDLVHGFYPLGSAGSGEVYFAKHGFAGASRHWRCPVFGAAVFFNRDIPKRWPSGVYWTCGNMSTRGWSYDDNHLQAKSEFSLTSDEGTVIIRAFEI